MRRFGLLMAVAVGLAGCSAQEALNFALKNRDLLTSGGTNEYEVLDREFQSLATDANVQFATTDTSVTVSRPGLIGTPTGTVQYQGVAEVDILIPGSPNGELAGDLELNADFVSGAIDGSITDVVDSAGSTYSSDLDIAGSVALQSGYGIDAQLTGTLTDGQSNTWTTDANVVGALSGVDGEYVSGTIAGTATVEGGGLTSIGGGFIGQAQP